MTKAIFEFFEDTEVDSLYIAQRPGHQTLAVIYRQPGETDWTCRVRFRSEVDDKVWGSDDTKRVMTATGALEPLRRAARATLDIMDTDGAAKIEQIEIGGKTADFIAIVRELPYFHAKQEGH